MAPPSRRGRAMLRLALTFGAVAAASAGSVVTIQTDAAGGKYFSVAVNGSAAFSFFPRGTVVSPVTTGGYVQGGGVVRQTPAQAAAMYTQAVAMGATATRVYDAAANCTTVPPILTCGAVTLAAAQAVGMFVLMGFKLPALQTPQGFSMYVAPAAAANTAAWLATSGINATIDALKGSPGLLAWTVGNEISLGAKSGMTYTVSASGIGSWTGTLTPGWANMWSLVSTITSWIKARDGNHPVGTCTPNVNADVVANGFQRYVPNLDFFGANVYGFAATGYVAKVAGIVGTTGWNKPYIASEYGMSNWFTSGFPTSVDDPNGWAAYAEDPSGAKAATYTAAWQSYMAGASTNIPSAGGGSGGLMAGAWAFNYGWVWQASATWVNMVNYYPFTYTAAAGGYDGRNSSLLGAWASGGEQSEIVDALTALYGGTLPTAAPAPSIPTPGVGIVAHAGEAAQYGGMNVVLSAGGTYTATVSVVSAFNASQQRAQWLLLPIPASPTDHSTYAPVLNASGGTGILSYSASGCRFIAPSSPGTYALTVWVTDPSGRFATAYAAFNTSTAPSAYMFATDADSYVYDAALYGSPGYNAGYSAANCTSGNLTCWHPAGTYQLQAYSNYGAVSTLVAQANRPPGNNRYPLFRFTFPGAGASAWRPSAASLPGVATLNVFVLGGDPAFNLTAYGYGATWEEATVTYESLGYAAGVPAVAGRQLKTTTAYGGLGAWVALDVSDYLLGVASANADTVAFALTAGSSTIYGGPVTTSALLASRECAAAAGGVCTATAPAGVNGALAAYLSILPSTAGITLQLSNTAATTAATAVAAGRRRARQLLQQAPPAPAFPGAPPAPPLSAAAQSEVEALRTHLAAMAGGGVTPSQVSLTISSHSVSASIILDGAHSIDSWSASVQQAFVLGVSADVGVSPTQIALSFVHDTADLSGLDVPFSVNGFVNASDGGLSAAQACVVLLSSGLASTLAAVRVAVTAHRIGDVRLNTAPTIYAQVATALAVPANTSATTQSLLTNAMGSGALETALRADGVVEHVAPAGRFANAARDLGLLGCAPAAETAGLATIAIVFIVYAGVITACCVSLTRRHSRAEAAAAAHEKQLAELPWSDKAAGVAAHASLYKLSAEVAAVRVYSEEDASLAASVVAPPPARVGSPRASSRRGTPRASSTPLSHDAQLGDVTL